MLTFNSTFCIISGERDVKCRPQKIQWVKEHTTKPIKADLVLIALLMFYFLCLCSWLLGL